MEGGGRGRCDPETVYIEISRVHFGIIVMREGEESVVFSAPRQFY